ncbi:MAG TPA: chemotaxis protein CheA [Planctomycetota bacterium]|nr:chemotaxis protein CheA [Planctomycetota bacterium]
MDDLVNDFLVESHENLERLDRAFLTLEQDPTAAEVLADVFRTIHTIKGTCGFLGFKKLERLSHGGESLLARVRDGERSFDAQISQALFELVDAVRAILAAVESTGAEGDASYDGLIEELLALCADESAAPALAQAAPASPKDPAPVESPTQAPASARSESRVRVDVETLDQLMNLVGELVLSRNQIRLHAETSVHAGLRSSSLRLAQLTSELQEGVMRTRMQPIGNVWSQVPRLVRDLCAKIDKRIRFEASGADTPIDRSILEMLRDPLMHMVRNSIDHGIETPSRRVESGKPAEGWLRVRAWASGGRVRLAIEDDGAGIDPVRIRQKALERGVIDAAQAAVMSDTEAVGLIFRPGFSTAEKLSNISGRGVGMDVVKTNIERLGGSVTIASRPGSGTRIDLSIPLTLAILTVVMVESGGVCFALPQTSVHELARVPPRGEPGAPISVQGARVLPLRGALLPLLSLRELLGLDPHAIDGEQHVVVLESDGRRFGLVVDALRDIQEIVVRPLGPALARVRVYSGAAILGDGRVALILDSSALAERGKVLHTQEIAGQGEHALEKSHVRRQLLLLDGGDAGQIAIELAQVLRLEEVPRERIERSFGHPVLRWRDEILPLGFLEVCLGAAPARETERRLGGGTRFPVVVCDVGGRRFGLIAQRILDVSEEGLEPCAGLLPIGIRERGSLGGAVVHLLDLEAIAARVLEAHASAASETAA